jgi:predicted metal-dependent peptidase
VSARPPSPADAGGDARSAQALQLERVQRALRRVTVPFPYLAGLAAAARVAIDPRLPTMGVFASGRMVANPAFTARLDDAELTFVVAHEMLHLALRTHQRAPGSDRLQFNFAHDYIINDILRAELGVTRIPAGGLDMPGARHRSAEEIVMEMRREAQAREAGAGAGGARRRVWQTGDAAGTGEGGGAGGAAGGDPRAGDGPGEEDGDVLADALERDWFGEDAAQQRERRRQADEAVRRGLAIARATGALRGPLGVQMGLAPGSRSEQVDARRGAYRTPHDLALQRWIESVAMGPRTFQRPSRRASGVSGAVLPGRRRESRILNVVLDTSGSMTDELPRALGAIGDFCEALGVDAVRLVQCDATVTADDTLAPQDLARRRIEGFGGSDLSPALRHLAADPFVRAVVVITDGDILHPGETMPYELLWLLPPQPNTAFRPAQGRVLHLSSREART